MKKFWQKTKGNFIAGTITLALSLGLFFLSMPVKKRLDFATQQISQSFYKGFHAGLLCFPKTYTIEPSRDVAFLKGTSFYPAQALQDERTLRVERVFIGMVLVVLWIISLFQLVTIPIDKFSNMVTQGDFGRKRLKAC